MTSCNKDISGIRGVVIIKEANTEMELTADDVEILLFSEGSDTPLKVTSTNSIGEFNFAKLAKKENWKIFCTTTINAITYSKTLTGIDTDGKSISNVKVILEN